MIRQQQQQWRKRKKKQADKQAKYRIMNGRREREKKWNIIFEKKNEANRIQEMKEHRWKKEQGISTAEMTLQIRREEGEKIAEGRRKVKGAINDHLHTWLYSRQPQGRRE